MSFGTASTSSSSSSSSSSLSYTSLFASNARAPVGVDKEEKTEAEEIVEANRKLLNILRDNNSDERKLKHYWMPRRLKPMLIALMKKTAAHRSILLSLIITLQWCNYYLIKVLKPLFLIINSILPLNHYPYFTSKHPLLYFLQRYHKPHVLLKI